MNNINNFYRKLAKESTYPFFIRSVFLVISSWLFQGLLYMDKTEKYFKILLEIVLLVFIYFLVSNMLNPVLSFIIAILASHTINWIFNGQIFVVFKNLRLIETETEDFIKFLDQITKRLDKEDSIILAATFGSLSRKELKKTSDLDVRVVRKKGLVNGVRSSFFVMLERSRAFFNRFPLDIYLLDNRNGLYSLDEDPNIFYEIITHLIN